MKLSLLSCSEFIDTLLYLKPIELILYAELVHKHLKYSKFLCSRVLVKYVSIYMGKILFLVMYSVFNVRLKNKYTVLVYILSSDCF